MAARFVTLITLVVAAAVACPRPGLAQQLTYSRDLDLVRRSAAPNSPLPNIYWVSLPLIPQIADRADTGSPLPNKCAGDIDGPPSGDGLINADDLICAWWTARADRATAGTFTLSRPLTSRCTLDFRSATVALGTVRFLGSPFPIEQGDGYQVRITVHQGDAATPRNRADIAGDPDPSFAGRPIVTTPTCAPGQTSDCCYAAALRLDLVSVPVNTLYATSDEILCGLEGVDWTDANRDGRPDRCWDDSDGDGTWDVGEATTGIFDGRVSITASRFLNTEEVAAPLSRSVTMSRGTVGASGTDFLLAPGDAYHLYLSNTHSPTVLLPPVP